MTLNERKAESIRKEIEKLNKSLTRYKGLLEKKIAKAEKEGCADWTVKDFRANYETMSQKQYEAWFDMDLAKDNVEDTERRIANAEQRLSKLLPKVEEDEEKASETARIDRIESNAFRILTAEERKKAEEEYQRWLEEFIKECAKDGVKIKEYFSNLILGETKSGKDFSMYLNNGFTERSYHCYTLYIDRKCVFTSGMFSTAYIELKK